MRFRRFTTLVSLPSVELILSTLQWGIGHFKNDSEASLEAVSRMNLLIVKCRREKVSGEDIRR
jgi:hypothetical protein